MISKKKTDYEKQSQQSDISILTKQFILFSLRSQKRTRWKPTKAKL